MGKKFVTQDFFEELKRLVATEKKLDPGRQKQPSLQKILSKRGVA